MDVVDAIHQALELQLQNRDDEALQILLAAAEQHDDEDLWFEIANFYAQRGLTRADEPALADFAEADKWAELPLTRAGLAWIATKRGEFDQAEALVTAAFELDPDLPMAHGALGALRAKQGRTKEAVESLAKAVEQQPKTALLWLLLAEALRSGGRADFAEKALLEGAKHCPGDDRVLVDLSRSYRERGDLAAARRALERAVAMNPQNVDGWRGLAWVAATDGQDMDMHRALEQSAAIDREGTLAWIAKESLTLPGLHAFGK